jgi:DNA-binding LacI/PurR family transcriptional regulator
VGIIFVGMMNEPTVQFYCQAGYQVICVDYWATTPLADAIVVDCYGEGQAAVHFLLSRGHRDLFYVGNMLTFRPPPEKESDAVLLLAGMQRAMEQAGLSAIPPERTIFVESLASHAEEVGEWLLSLRPRPTAGFVFGAAVCRGLREALARRSVRCPEDVSLVAKLWSGEPGDFACLRSDPRKIGELAVDTLLDRLRESRTTGRRIALTSRLDPGCTVHCL